MFFPHFIWKILFNVLTNHLDFAVRSLSVFVDNQVRVISTKVVEDDRNLETDRALQVALAVGGAKEESRNVVVVTDLRPLRIVFLERVAADVALPRDLRLYSFLSTHALYRSILSELLHDRRVPLDEHVQELGERIFSDLYHRQLIVLSKKRAEDGDRSAHIVLLGVGCMLFLGTERLENGL